MRFQSDFVVGARNHIDGSKVNLDNELSSRSSIELPDNDFFRSGRSGHPNGEQDQEVSKNLAHNILWGW